MIVTAQQVADFLGRGSDTATVAAAGETLPLVQAMASAYTRGGGFTTVEGAQVPTDDLAAVLVTATARLLANPSQLGYKAGDESMPGGFTGWTLVELFVLNRYRKRAA